MEKNVTPNVRPVQDKYLSFTYMMMKNLANGVPDKEPPASSLVRVPDILKGTVSEALVEELDETTHAALIYRHEFLGMAGDAGRLQDTLGAYVSQGVLWGQDKAFFISQHAAVPERQAHGACVCGFARQIINLSPGRRVRCLPPLKAASFFHLARQDGGLPAPFCPVRNG